MLLEDKSVTTVMTADGQEIDRAEGGYHLQLIVKTLIGLHDKHKDLCKAAFDKYFGEGTEYFAQAKAAQKLAAKPKEEQTQEDLAELLRFKELQTKTIAEYKADPKTPRVKVTYHRPKEDRQPGEPDEIVIFDADLILLAHEANADILDPNNAVREVKVALFDLMRRSGLKLAAAVLKFDEDEPDAKNANYAMVLVGSKYRTLKPEDLNVVEGALDQIKDKNISEARKELGFKEEPKIIL